MIRCCMLKVEPFGVLLCVRFVVYDGSIGEDGVVLQGLQTVLPIGEE